MTDRAQHEIEVSQFQDEIRAVIRRATQERDLLCADVIGVLELEKANFIDGMNRNGK